MARLFNLKSDAVEDVPAEGCHVLSTVKGYIADTEMTFTYQNPSDEPWVAEFQFPMLDGAALYYFQAKFLDRIIEAECQELNQAKETYRDAVESRRTAFLLRQNEDSGDIFRCDLGNIPPLATVTLKLKYAQELSLEAEGGTSLTIPTVMRQRYTPAGSVQQGQALPSVSSGPSLGSPHVSVELRVDPTYTTKSVECKHYTATVDRSPDCVKVNIEKCAASEHDIIFKIRYADEYQPSVVMEKGTPDTDNFMSHPALMVSMVPEMVSGTSCAPREFVFVVDQSGSMGGDRIERSKEALLFCLKSLPVGCYFNIIGFGSTFRSCFPESREYTEKSLSEALVFQRNIDANMGGTEMLSPLTSVYSQPAKAARQIFILTDGAISYQSEVLKLVKTNAKTSRTFSFGIGHGVSTSLVQGLARAGGGKAEFIVEPANIKSKVLSSLQCAMQPALENIKLDWVLPAGVDVMQLPKTPSVIFAGHHLIVYAILISKKSKKQKLDIASLHGSVILEATGSDGSNLKHSLLFDLGNADTSTTPHNQPLHRLAAKAQLQELSLNEGQVTTEKGSSANVMVLTSVASNVSCQHTAFVAVDKSDATKPVVIPGAPPPYPGDDISYRMHLKEYSLGVECCSSAPYRKGGGALKGGFSLGLPSMSGIGRSISRGFHRLSARKSRKSRQVVSGTSAVQCDSSASYESPIASSMAQSKDQVTVIVDMQSFDGSWQATKELSDLLGLDQLLTEYNPLKDEVVWATVMVMAWLRLNQSARKSEWTLVVEKARRWLDTQDLEGAAVEELIAQAEKVLQK